MMTPEKACRVVDSWGDEEDWGLHEIARTLRQALAEAQDSVHELRGELYAVGYERDATGEALAEAQADLKHLRRKLDALLLPETAAVLAKALCDYQLGGNSVWDSGLTDREGRIAAASHALRTVLAAVESDPT